MQTRTLRPHPKGFHGDRHLLRLVDRLAERALVFVETNAGAGSTLGHVARGFPGLECFSCEPDAGACEVAREHACVRDGVTLTCEQPRELLRRIAREHASLAGKPMFAWLDARTSAEGWTLREEVRLLTKSFERGYVLIDDLRVPHNDNFAWDRRAGTGREFHEFVSAIAPGTSWRFYYPEYSEHTSTSDPLCGWGLLQFTRGAEELERLESEFSGVCRLAGFSLASAARTPAPQPSAPAPVASDAVPGITFQSDPNARRSAPSATPLPAAKQRHVTLLTFGFKYGLPNTNYYFDVSFVKNPARDARWSLHSQPDEAMRRFVLEQPAAQKFLERLVPLVATLVDCDDDVRIGLGCNSGRHRSIIVAQELARRLSGESFEVRVIHREEEFR